MGVFYVNLVLIEETHTQLILHIQLHGIEVGFGGVDAADGFTGANNLLGQDDAGIPIIFGRRLLQRSLHLLLLALNSAYLTVQLIALLPDLVGPFLHLKGKEFWMIKTNFPKRFLISYKSTASIR